MKANKTQPTSRSVVSYLADIGDDQQRGDAVKLAKLMEEATGLKPVLWGSSIVGFGKHHYVYESGREGDTAVVGFAVRKNAIVLYGVLFYSQNEGNVKLAQKLGPHTHGKGCLYIKSLSDVDLAVLKEMVENAFRARSGKG